MRTPPDPHREQLSRPGDQELVTVVVAASDCSRWFRAVFELLLPIWLLGQGASPIQAAHRTSGTTLIIARGSRRNYAMCFFSGERNAQ